MPLKIYSPTPDGFNEMILNELTDKEEAEAHKEMVCWETQEHLKVCKKCQKKFQELTKIESLAEDTARDCDWGLKTEVDENFYEKHECDKE